VEKREVALSVAPFQDVVKSVAVPIVVKVPVALPGASFLGAAKAVAALPDPSFLGAARAVAALPGASFLGAVRAVAVLIVVLA
jgi:hypothetical protein